MKKFLMVFACLALCFFLVSCDSNSPGNPVSNSKEALFNKTLPGSGHLGDITPKLSPEGDYLLALQNGILILKSFPENDLIDTFSLGENQSHKEFKWSPTGDIFAYYTEGESPGDAGAVYISTLDGVAEKIASLDAPELGTRELLWSPCGSYLFWAKPFSIYNKKTGELLVKAELDAKHSFVRSPLFADDGSVLAFTLLRGDGSENLWVINTSTGVTGQVTARGDGDYPFYWMDNNTLLVKLGAISTGGGNIYGLAEIDLETGEMKPLCLSTNDEDRGLQRFCIAKGVSPEQGYFVGESHNTAGTDSKVFRQALTDGKQEIILDGYHLLQTLWINEEELLLAARQESSDGRRAGYQLFKYSEGNGCTALLKSEAELHLLGIKDNQLYYLESNQPGTHWLYSNIDLDPN